MTPSLEFEFLGDDSDGQLVPIGGPLVQLRALLAGRDIDSAVRLFEETNGSARAGLILEATTGSNDLKKSTATMFRRSRDFAAAAQVYEVARMDAEAATCFEQANDFARAGDAWKRAGEITKAAAALERAGRLDDAIALYGQSGSKEQMAEALVRARRYETAAALYRDVGNLHAEVETLRLCVAESPSAVAPALRLAELMANHGHAPRAAELLMDCARSSPRARDDQQLLTALATLLEATGNQGAASKVRARLQQKPKEAQPVPVLRAALDKPGDAEAYGFLKALPMFADLSLEDMRSLFRVCVHHGFGAGMDIIEPGQPGRGLFVITDGQVDVFSGLGPDARRLNSLGVGGYLGEISLLLDGPTSARVTARTPVKALFISREAFKQYVFNTPTAALRIYRLFSVNLAERVRALSSGR